MKLPQYLTTITPFSKYLAMALFILFPLVGFFLGMQYQKFTHQQLQPQITNFVECKNAGYPVFYSYPAQCRTPDGRTFMEAIPTATSVSATVAPANPRSCSDCPSGYNFCQNTITKQTGCINSAIMAPQPPNFTCTFCPKVTTTVSPATPTCTPRPSCLDNPYSGCNPMQAPGWCPKTQ